MTLDLTLRGDGRVALITGAASGLGRAMSELFAEAGYRVAALDRDGEAGRQLAGDLAGRGLEATFVAADVAREDEVAAAVAAAGERWGRLDVLVNNAGVLGPPHPIDELPGEELDRVIAVNLKGPFLLCKHAVPRLRSGGGGAILNVSSIQAERGAPEWAAYCASKAGVVALTHSLARRLGRHNIRVNCLRPGSVRGTRLMSAAGLPSGGVREAAALAGVIPLGRAAQPRDVAPVALFLCSPLAAHVHGAVITVDGGEALGPA